MHGLLALNDLPHSYIGLAIPTSKFRLSSDSDEESLCSFSSTADIFVTPPKKARKSKDISHRFVDKVLPSGESIDNVLGVPMSHDKLVDCNKNMANLPKYNVLKKTTPTMNTKNIPGDSESSSESSSDDNGTSQEMTMVKPSIQAPIITPPNMTPKGKASSGSSSDSEEDSSSSDEDSSPQNTQPSIVGLQPLNTISHPVALQPQVNTNKKLVSDSHKMSDSSSSDSDEEPNLQPPVKTMAPTNHTNVTVRNNLPATSTVNKPSLSLGKQAGSESTSDSSSDESNHDSRPNTNLLKLPSNPLISPLTVNGAQLPISSTHALSNSDSSSDTDSGADTSKSNIIGTQSSSTIPNLNQMNNPMAGISSNPKPTDNVPNRPVQSSSDDSSDDSSDSDFETRRPIALSLHTQSQVKSNPQPVSSEHQTAKSDSSSDEEGGPRPSTSKSAPEEAHQSKSTGKQHETSLKTILIAHQLTQQSDESSSSSSVSDNYFSQSYCANPTLQSVLPPQVFEVDKSPSLIYAEDLGSDDEIWMVQTPRGISKEVLLEQHVKLGGMSKFSVHTTNGVMKFKARCARHKVPQNKVLVLRSRATNEFKLVPLSTIGQVIVTRSLTVPKVPEFQIVQKGNVPMPQGLKIRHPFFGADYEKDIQERNKSHDVPIKLPKKEKKKSNSVVEEQTKASDVGANQVSSTADNYKTPVAGTLALEKKKAKKNKKDKKEEKGGNENKNSYSADTLNLYNNIQSRFTEFTSKGLDGIRGEAGQTTGGESDKIHKKRHSKKKDNTTSGVGTSVTSGDSESASDSRKKKSDKTGNERSSLPLVNGSTADRLEDVGMQNIIGVGKDTKEIEPKKHKKKKKDKHVVEGSTNFGSPSPSHLKSDTQNEDISFYQHVGLTYTSTPTNEANVKRKSNIKRTGNADRQSISHKEGKKSREFKMNSEEKCESAELFNELLKTQKQKLLIFSQSQGVTPMSNKKAKKRSKDHISGEHCVGSELEASPVKRQKIVSPSAYLPVLGDEPQGEIGQNKLLDGPIKHKSKKKKKDKDRLEEGGGIENPYTLVAVEERFEQGINVELTGCLTSGKNRKGKKLDELKTIPLQDPNLYAAPSEVLVKEAKRKSVSFPDFANSHSSSLDQPESVVKDMFRMEHSQKKKKKNAKDLREVNVETCTVSSPAKKNKKRSKSIDLDVPVQGIETQLLPTFDKLSNETSIKKKKKKEKEREVEEQVMKTLLTKAKLSIPDKMESVSESQSPQISDLPLGSSTKHKRSKKEKKNAENTGCQETDSQLSFAIPKVPGQKKSKRNEQDSCGFDSDASVRKMFITQKFVEKDKKEKKAKPGKIAGF